MPQQEVVDFCCGYGALQEWGEDYGADFQGAVGGLNVEVGDCADGGGVLCWRA